MAGRSGRLAFLAVSLVALSVAACATTPTLRMAGTSEGAIGVAHVPTDQPVSVGDVILCLSAPGTATIRSVALHQPTGDIKVQAFATRPNPFARGLDAVGDPQSTIDGLHLDLDPAAPAVVSGVCPADVATAPTSASAQEAELVIQVVRGSGDDAGAAAIDLTYGLDGQARTAVIPFGIWLCAATCPPQAGELYQP